MELLKSVEFCQAALKLSEVILISAEFTRIKADLFHRILHDERRLMLAGSTFCAIMHMHDVISIWKSELSLENCGWLVGN